MPAGISLDATNMRRSQRVIHIIWNHEHPIIVQIITVKIQVEIVHVIPVIIPVADSDEYRIGTEEQVHITVFLYPVSESCSGEAPDCPNEPAQLFLSLSKLLFMRF